MRDFVFENKTKVYFGKEQMCHLHEEVARFGKRVLLVYGGGSIKRIGLYDKVMAELQKAGAEVFELAGVEPNPRHTTVNKGDAICKQEGIDVLLAVGGGSTIDATKAIAAGAKYEGDDVWDLITQKAVVNETLPIVTVLTLSATGSEMDGGCVISNVETNEKLGYFAPDNNPDVSFLDPTNTFSVGAYQTACGSVDIMSHIFDVAYFSKKQSMDMLLRIQEEVLKTVVKYAPMAVLYFLENHDEQRIASSFFAGEAQNGVPGLVVSALLQKNPLMIYFGQEYGEKGMDKEGFSGNDGRTTIFDYWSVDTIVRVAHQKLTSQEKQLKAIYDKVIDIATTEKAVGSGASFDLMYVNGQYNHEYAFIRKSGAEVLLVVANFADSNQTIGVTIPGHAFDFLNMKEKNAQATDLLSGEKQKLSLKRDEAVLVNVQAKSAVVLKFKA